MHTIFTLLASPSEDIVCTEGKISVCATGKLQKYILYVYQIFCIQWIPKHPMIPSTTRIIYRLPQPEWLELPEKFPGDYITFVTN